MLITRLKLSEVCGRLLENHSFRLFDEMNVGIDSRTPQLKNGASSAMQEVLDIVNSFAVGLFSFNIFLALNRDTFWITF